MEADGSLQKSPPAPCVIISTTLTRLTDLVARVQYLVASSFFLWFTTANLLQWPTAAMPETRPWTDSWN